MMRKTVLFLSIISVIFFFFSFQIKAQTSDSSDIKAKLYRYWELREFKENEKVQVLPEFLIEFRQDGSYYSIEENEPDNGLWTLSNDNSKIIFDIDTPNRDEWTIISIEDSKLMIKFSNEGKNYQYTLLPAVLDFK